MKHPVANLSLLSFILTAESFQPNPILTRKPLSLLSSVDVDFYNPSRGMDMEHAHDCAEHFGKCSIEDLEKMRSGER